MTLLRQALPGLIGILVTLVLLVVLWALLFRRASRLLLAQQRRCSSDQLSELEVPEGVGTRHVLLWVLVMLLLLAWHAGGNLSLLLLGGLLLSWMLPAATLVLSRVGSLTDALYPPAWMEVIHDLGKGRYLLLCGCLLLLAAGYLLLDRLFQNVEPWFRNAVLMAWWAYAVMAWFAMLGQAMAPRGATPARPPPRPVAAVDGEVLFEQLLKHGGSNEDHRCLFNALLLQQDTDRLKALALRWLPALLEGFDRPEEAVERSAQLLDALPDFSLETPSGMLALIKASEKHGYPDLTIRLCRNFLASFPVAPKRETVKAILSRTA